MPQQLDIMDVLATLTETVLQYRTRIGELETRLAALPTSDMQMQVQKLTSVSKKHPKIRRVVFVGRGYFGDNIKYAFLDFIRCANQNDCDVRFLPPEEQQEETVRSAGLPTYSCDFGKWTAADVRSALETSIVVNCDHNHMWKWKDLRIRALFEGAKQVQLWHGIPIKEIGLKYVRGGNVLSMQDCEILDTSGRFDVFVGTSQKSETEWRRFFIFDRYEFLGYPRNDALMREATTQDLLNVDLMGVERVKAARQSGKPVYIYAPTFRDHIGPGWFPPAGLLNVLASPVAQKAFILINLHPFDQNAVSDFANKYPSLYFLQPGTDLYPVLRFANALITDYSSLIFDFLLLDRPIVLYRPDHDHYQAQSRSLFDDKLAVMPGAVCSTAAELTSALEGLLRGEDNAAPARQHLREMWFDYPDGKSAERLSKLILSLLPAR